MSDTPESSFRSTDSDGHPFGILMNVMENTRIVMDVADELNDIKAAEDAVVKRDDERAAVADKIREDLRILSAQYQAAVTASQRPKGTPSAAEHEATVRDLENRSYAIGKALNDEQAAVAKKEVEIGRAKAEREEVRKWDPSSSGGNDTHVIRLRMFEQLGFKLVEDRPAKVLIRNDRLPDINVHTVGANRVQSANAMWECAG